MHKHQYIKTLDGWRALAVIAVILSHLKDSVLSPESRLFNIFSAGINGVDLFFAISGYLIASNLFKELDRDETVNFKRFYLKRFFRLMPASWCYLLVIFLMTPSLITVLPIEFISTLTFWRNYLIMDHSYTGQFWSLMVEEHFYFFLPFFLFSVREPKKILISIVGIGITVALWRKLGTMPSVVEAFPPIEYTMWNTFGRFDTLLYGVLLATIQRYFPKWDNVLRKIPIFAPIVALLCLFLVKIPFKPTFEAILYPLIIYSTICHSEGWFGRFLENPLFRFIGKISYSLYLWQQLFVAPFPRGPEWFRALGGEWHSIGVIFVVATISYYLIEDPFRKLGQKWSSHA